MKESETMKNSVKTALDTKKDLLSLIDYVKCYHPKIFRMIPLSMSVSDLKKNTEVMSDHYIECLNMIGSVDMIDEKDVYDGQTVDIMSYAINLYFHTYSVTSDLLEQMTLKIVLNDGTKETLIYEGPLDSKELERQFILTQIPSGATQYLNYTIHMPHELDNQYTLLEDEVRWMFSVQEMGKPPKTGDIWNMPMLICALSLGGAFLILIPKKKKKEGTVS